MVGLAALRLESGVLTWNETLKRVKHNHLPDPKIGKQNANRFAATVSNHKDQPPRLATQI